MAIQHFTGRLKAKARSIRRAGLRVARQRPRTQPDGVEVAERSPFDNIYHCSIQRAASQWFRGVFTDPDVWRHTGLAIEPYREIGHRRARLATPFPKRTIVTALYIDYPTYMAISKPERYRAFYVMRDPRDALVSFYFAMRYSHRPTEEVAELRPRLRAMGLEDGLHLLLDWMDDVGFFASQVSWVSAELDSSAKLFRYEDLAADHRVFLGSLLAHLEINIPQDAFEGLTTRHSFSAVAGGRHQGVEDPYHHFRKGVPGEWVEFFSPDLVDHFRSVTRDDVEKLGYGW